MKATMNTVSFKIALIEAILGCDKLSINYILNNYNLPHDYRKGGSHKAIKHDSSIDIVFDNCVLSCHLKNDRCFCCYLFPNTMPNEIEKEIQALMEYNDFLNLHYKKCSTCGVSWENKDLSYHIKQDEETGYYLLCRTSLPMFKDITLN